MLCTNYDIEPMDIGEQWFLNCYLNPRQFKVSPVRRKDFEGIIKDGKENNICLFELKYLENPNRKDKVDKAFCEAKNNDELIPFPEWKNIKSDLRDRITKATKQLKDNVALLSEKEGQGLPRVIFIITTQVGNTGESEVVDAIKGGRRLEFDGKSKIRFGYNSEFNDNTAINIFSDRFISGVIVIYPMTLKFQEEFGIQKVLVVKNKVAESEIPKILFDGGYRSVKIISI